MLRRITREADIRKLELLERRRTTAQRTFETSVLCRYQNVKYPI